MVASGRAGYISSLDATPRPLPSFKVCRLPALSTAGHGHPIDAVRTRALTCQLTTSTTTTTSPPFHLQRTRFASKPRVLITSIKADTNHERLPGPRLPLRSLARRAPAAAAPSFVPPSPARPVQGRRDPTVDAHTFAADHAPTPPPPPEEVRTVCLASRLQTLHAAAPIKPPPSPPRPPAPYTARLTDQSEQQAPTVGPPAHAAPSDTHAYVHAFALQALQHSDDTAAIAPLTHRPRHHHQRDDARDNNNNNKTNASARISSHKTHAPPPQALVPAPRRLLPAPHP